MLSHAKYECVNCNEWLWVYLILWLSWLPEASIEGSYDEEVVAGHNLQGMDETQLRAFFDIDGTVSWVKLHEYSRIALQFPDYFLRFSANVAALLESDCDGNAKTFILADTTYRRYY